MSDRIPGQPIDWYWIPIDRKALMELSRESDLRGPLQTFGFFAVLACTGSAAYYSAGHWPWYVTVALLFLHGTCWAFLGNAFHEFSHGTVCCAPWRGSGAPVAVRCGMRSREHRSAPRSPHSPRLHESTTSSRCNLSRATVWCGADGNAM